MIFLLLLSMILSILASNSEMGMWDVAGSSAVVCIHTALLPNSKLLCMERPHMPPYPINALSSGMTAVEIDLKGRSSSFDSPWLASNQIRPTIYNTFCAGVRSTC